MTSLIRNDASYTVQVRLGESVEWIVESVRIETRRSKFESELAERFGTMDSNFTRIVAFTHIYFFACSLHQRLNRIWCVYVHRCVGTYARSKQKNANLTN